VAAATAATSPAAPAGITGSGAVRASSTVKNTRTASARPANRRSHPRTVDAARPATPAILRCPSPAAAASSAAPITAAESARRSRHHAGNSTCVAPHWRHRDLRGTSTASGPFRHLHPPQPRVPPPAQHPAARRARQFPARQQPLDLIPVTVYREHDASARHPAALPGASPKDHGEGRTTTDPLTVQPGRPARNPATATPPLPSAKCRRR
jgi:hypothetical protein